MRRSRKNIHERRFEELARSKGWYTTKRGWPDFFCVTDEDEVIAVEVKPRIPKSLGGRLIKGSQEDVFRALTAAGIRCFVSNGYEMILWENEGEHKRCKPQTHVLQFEAT